MHLSKISGVGEKTTEYLKRLNITTIHDLILHFPLKYQDRTQVTSIQDLQLDTDAVVEGYISNIAYPKAGRTKLLCTLSDDTGKLVLRFFNIKTFQFANLKVGNKLRCYGEIKSFANHPEMFHPEFKIIKDGEVIPEPYFTAFYPLTQGITQNKLRHIIKEALHLMGKEVFYQELLPEEILQAYRFPTITAALCSIHQPSIQSIELTPLNQQNTLAHQRIFFEELLAHRLSLVYLKQLFRAQKTYSISSLENALTQTFLQKLPFQLTPAQTRVLAEINHDLTQCSPMLRLIQGDVGSGKTIVAALAMLNVVASGYQAVLMAPTELLAEQHARTFMRWFSPLGVSVALLTGQIKGSERKKLLDDVVHNRIPILIGTHALFQNDIAYEKLALIVIDEQHRFGVQQRALLKEKGMRTEVCPHQLLMTATPIPRSLAMSLYQDLDCSIIDELPPGRKPIITSVISAKRREDVIRRIEATCCSGKQVYWVCPLIEESDRIHAEAATVMAEELQRCFGKLKVGLLHGRMSTAQKEQTMQAFESGEIDILVATTVIEVGVDVPNASLIIIENSEKLGLAQLHQLRGRVGRGHTESYCLLLYGDELTAMAKERLQIMRETTDGFRIAQRDLELRGPGKIIGTEQTGDLGFQKANLIRDAYLIPKVNETAEKILKYHPDVILPIIERWLALDSQYLTV